MSVTTNTIGTNTRQIVISGETSINNILTAVSNALVALGWTAYDTVTTGTNNAQVRQIFRVLNADATTYKYLGILWHPNKGLFHTTAYESWNSSTHVGTNEVFTNGYTFPSGVQYSNCSIYVMASARWAVLYSTIRGEYGPWSGVFEFEREAAEDTVGAGFPCFAWTNSNIIGEPVGHSATVGTSNHDSWCVSFPRTPHPYTGIAAAQFNTLISGFGMFPPSVPTAGLNTSHANKLGGLSSGYAWDSAKKAVHVLKGAGVGNAQPRGRMFGVKAIGPIGDPLDTVVLPIDANYHYASSGGTNTDHWVLPMNGGYHMSYAYAGNRLAATLFGTGMSGTDAYDGVLVKGKYIYAGCVSGIWKIDMDAATCTLVYSTAAAISSVEYDGGAYIYFATSAGVTRLAIADDSLTHLTAGVGGCTTLAIDEDYIYASQRTASTTSKVDVISRSSFTVLGTSTFSATASAVAPTAMCVDYAGNCYACTGGNDSYLNKVVGSTRANSRVGLSTCSGYGTAPSGIYCSYDGELHVMYMGYNNSGGINNGWGNYRVDTSLTVLSTNIFTVPAYADMRPASVSHPATPMKGVAVGVHGPATSQVTSTPVKAASLMDNVAGYSASYGSFPGHSASGHIINNIRNMGSFYIGFTNNDTNPICVTTGMHGKYNWNGQATAHLLLPA